MNKEFPGVFEAKKKDNTTYFRVSITHKGKHISLGSFDNKEDASRAYIEADNTLKDSALSVEDIYESLDERKLSFDKYISLINFRDNGLYIANPIYISKKLFYYYLTPTIILKFDADDLFFYSSHKIMQRGGRLFVSEYGKQISVASRYGIKSNAVLQRDYRFKNGDIYDYRISNIEILNIYNGVSKCKYKKKTKYKSIIHIHGNYTIGHYITEEEAAIAYNKAVDFLLKAGIKKDYAKNELPDISQKNYDEIYKKIIIPDSIRDYVKNQSAK